MKTILVPVQDGQVPRSVFDSALLVAKRFASYVEGFHTRHPLSELVRNHPSRTGVFTTVIGGLEEAEEERAKAAKDLFGSFMEEQGVPWSDSVEPSDRPTAGWTEQEGLGESPDAERSRLFDLIVVEPEARTKDVPRLETAMTMDPRPASHLLQTILFESGRPVLIAPLTPPKSLGDNIAICWNSSLEAARTMTFAMPFLAAAKKISVFKIEDTMVPGPSAAEAAEHLARHGIAADTIVVDRGRRSVGEAILETAAELNADLLVKSAYTHSRARELVFGGGTSHVLKEAELPVLTAH